MLLARLIYLVSTRDITGTTEEPWIGSQTQHDLLSIALLGYYRKLSLDVVKHHASH